MESLYSREERMVYKILMESMESPLSMLEIRDRVQNEFGVRNEQMDRRLRGLRTHFEIPATRADLGYVYPLVGWRGDAGERTRRARLSPRVEAKVYAAYGGRCAWCGKNSQDDGVRVVIDHKIPLDLNGTDEFENLQLLCVKHNHAKQAMFGEFEEWSSALKAAITLEEAHLRIGEFLKAAAGRQVPVDLINLVAREENRGDPTRRMRELRALGWKIDVTRRKTGARTLSYYTLRHWEPWPAEGPRAAINRLEAARKRKRKAESSKNED
jgi:hypothetical protein